MNTNEGWGFPNGSRKAHYFRDTISLCRRYGFYMGPLDSSDKQSPDDCRECRRKRDKESVTSIHQG